MVVYMYMYSQEESNEEQTGESFAGHHQQWLVGRPQTTTLQTTCMAGDPQDESPAGGRAFDRCFGRRGSGIFHQ